MNYNQIKVVQSNSAIVYSSLSKFLHLPINAKQGYEECNKLVMLHIIS